MNKTKNIKINAVLNVIKTCLSIIFPLFTYPIVLKALGTEGVGKVSYVQSIIMYFALFAMLGVSTYAVREGSKLREQKDKLNEFVSEVLTINVIFTLLSCVFLFLLVFIIPAYRNYLILFGILWIDIISRTFAIEWVNTIFEDYFFITVRTIVANVLILVLTIILIHNPNDFYKYAVLTILPNAIVCVTNWIYCRRYVKLRFTLHPHIKQHIKPLIVLFFNAIMVSIYVNFDNTMLGMMKGDHYVGIYTLSVRLYTVMKNVLAAVYIVATARLSSYAGKNEWKGFKNLLSKTSSVLSLLIIPASIGIISTAEEIVFVFGDVEYAHSVGSMKLLAVALIFATFGGLVTSCLNVPLNREGEVLLVSSVSSAANVLLNFFFIPWLDCNGAAITTIISELIVVVLSLIRIKNKKTYLDFKMIGVNLIDAALGSVLILLYSIGIKYVLYGVWTRLIAIISGSVLIYVLILIVRKNKCFFEELKNIKIRVLKLIGRS